jgi:hypothetical protein
MRASTALEATSRSPLLLVSYLETYLGRLEHWLRSRVIAVNVSNNMVVLIAKTAKAQTSPVFRGASTGVKMLGEHGSAGYK